MTTSQKTAGDCADAESRYDQIDTHFHSHPALLPLRTYSVTSIDCLTARHEGRGLDLDRVLACEAQAVEIPVERLADERLFDLAVWEGDRVVAVIRHSGNAVETIRLPAPPPAGGE